MILVDEIKRYSTNLPRKQWCHLVSDKSFDELHEFAAKIGLKREWFQRDHYDLTRGKRAQAVRAGAAEVPSSELAKRRIR